MDKKSLDGLWDRIRQKYGIYLRVLEAIPDERYQTHPVPGMRTPAELAVHTSGSVFRDLAVGVAKGEVTADESAEAELAAGMTKQDALAYARACWEEADAAVAGIGDAELAAMVPTPWGTSFPGWFGFEALDDELLHHRGQLYAYCRACGVAPPSMWGFEENEPGFRPGG